MVNTLPGKGLFSLNLIVKYVLVSHVSFSKLNSIHVESRESVEFVQNYFYLFQK